MKQIILLSLFVAYCSAATAFDKRCMWGPSYWCSDVKAAKSCGAMKHCIMTVWTHDKPIRMSSQNDIICDYCKNLVSDARKFLEEKRTQDEIKQYLDEACSIIPDASFATKCKEVVNDYFPELMQILESEMDPASACAALGMCTGFEDHVHGENPPLLQSMTARLSARVNNTYCADCKKFFTDVREIITSKKTETQIEEMIEDTLCTYLGELKDLCKEIVDTYTPQILSLLANQVDPSLTCGAIGMCVNGDRTLLARMRLRTSPLYKGLKELKSTDTECLLCKTVFAELQSLDLNKATQESIKSFIEEKICAHLGSLAGECKLTVQLFGQDLFEILANMLNPVSACPELGFCSAAQNKVTPHEAPTLHVNDAQRVDVHHMKHSTKVKTSEECVLCEFVMKEVDQLLSQNATEAEITAALDKVCSLLPSSISDECAQFVNTYTPAIIKLLSAELSPSMVCTTLGLCKSNSQETLTFKKVDSSTEVCDTCQLVMQYVDSLLEQNSTVQELEKLLDKACNFLPKSYAAQCDDIVKIYGPAVVQLIAQFADPREVCTDIGLCSNMSAVAKPERKTPTPGLVHLLGAHKCTFGPSFWCVNMDNAKKCNAVSHCQKHVWNN